MSVDLPFCDDFVFHFGTVLAVKGATTTKVMVHFFFAFKVNVLPSVLMKKSKTM